MAAIGISTAVVTMAAQWHDSNSMATVMNSDGWCDGNAAAMPAMEGATATQRQRNGNAAAMEGATAMAINGAMATQ